MKKLQMDDAGKVDFVRITRDINLFASMMNIGVMETILSRVEFYEFAPGDKVFRQGGAGDAFYAVLSGRLKVSVREAFLFSRKIAELKDGDFFGEMALVNRAPRSATVACETASRVFMLRSDDFQAAMRENPKFSEEIKKLASDRLFELKYGSSGQ